MTAIKLVKGADAARFSQSKIGGEPALGDQVLFPLDRAGKAMNFLLQINFSELSTELRGMLLVFTASDIDKAQTKDRKSYRLIWEPAETPDTVQAIADSGVPLVPGNDTIIGDQTVCEILPSEHQRMREAQLICAFSSNGITYSEVRAEDDCYSHLVEQAPKYVPFFYLKTETKTNFLSLIHQDDLDNRLIEKAWLLRF